ncbi:MAG TPA: cytidylate kinase family protein [Polyangia bacterium]|jgi:cytidylate kinase
MAIVTISRGTFTAGEQLAALVAERLGYRVISREALFKRVAETYGISAEVLDGLRELEPPLAGAAVTSRQRMLVAVQASLCDLVGQDRVVYHGHVAHLLLPGVGHTLKVRIVAPRAQRVKLAMEREHLSELEAHRHIEMIDAGRARWARNFYGADWTDPALYDMVLNLEWMSVESVADLLVAATHLPCFQPTEQSLARLRDISLASRVRARLMSDDSTADLALDVTADDGHVRVSGLQSQANVGPVTEVVRRVPGVEHVEAAPALRGR